MDNKNSGDSSVASNVSDNVENPQAENCENVLAGKSIEMHTEVIDTLRTTVQKNIDQSVNVFNNENETKITTCTEDNRIEHTEDVHSDIINKESEVAQKSETIDSNLKDEQQERNTSDAVVEMSVSTPAALLNMEKTVVPADKTVEIESLPTENASSSQKQIKTEPTENNALPKNNANSFESFATVVVKSEPKKPLVGATNFITKSSLGLLAQYDSESDEGENKNEENDVMEVAVDSSKDYRNKVIEIHSESESDSSTSSDSDVEYIAKIRKEIEKNIDLEDDEDAENDDDEDESSMGKNKKKKAQNSMRVKGELGLDDLPPIQDLQISVPENECIVLGKIHSIVDQLVLVSALPDSMLYDLETVLFLDKGKRVLGEVFDVLGQVADPIYCVRFNSHNEIEEKGIKVGDAVYVAPKTEHTQFVILSSLMKMRGSDASWENDVEPPPRYLDYSDDEQEREARQRIRNKDRSANKEAEEHEEASKRARDEIDETSSVSSMSTVPEISQTRRAQRGRGNMNAGRFNRGNDAQQRQRYNNQRSPQQMHRNQNAGSWHSNYNRPYAFNQPHTTMPPMPPMPHPMNPMAYPMFGQYSTAFTPQMTPPLQHPNMFVQNPYAMRPPQMDQGRAYERQFKPRSPSPPPPGME